MNHQHYRPSYFPVPPHKRTWPDNIIKQAPMFCSVDLRDGNQALTSPMTCEEKLRFFNCLVSIGLREIEVGFPAASETEYAFVRTLIDDGHVKDGVSIQVLTQIREHIMEKTFRAIDGAKDAIVHLYNSTSRLQREAVFGFSMDEAKALAVKGAHLARAMASRARCGRLRFEYSPESFSATEPAFALSVINAVIEAFDPHPESKLIINLPETVQLATPNVFADAVEYINQNIVRRDSVIVSVHTHNDRGTAVASSELSLLAGAERVEGTLFGNGERTGNADLLVLALNLMSHGIDPTLDFSDLPALTKLYEDSTKMLVPARHPYAGELVFTAFSGSHQDAIRKGFAASAARADGVWANPYLPIDPADVGRVYEPIRINSQSGTGGILYILERKYGIYAPKPLVIEFSHRMKSLSDKRASELSPEIIYRTFIEQYVSVQDRLSLVNYKVSVTGTRSHLCAEFAGALDGVFEADGNGPLDALNTLINRCLDIGAEITAYHEHALERTSSSEAMAFIAIRCKNGSFWGAGCSTNINTASMEAYISAVNRSMKPVDTL